MSFNATASEQRIISDLTAIFKRRKLAIQPSDNFASAAAYIAALEQQLFPETYKLRAARAAFIAPLRSSNSRATFDNDLETATLTINATLRSREDYADFLSRLKNFDFDAWLLHCEAERIHAD